MITHENHPAECTANSETSFKRKIDKLRCEFKNARHSTLADKLQILSRIKEVEQARHDWRMSPEYWDQFHISQTDPIGAPAVKPATVEPVADPANVFPCWDAIEAGEEDSSF